MMQETAAKDIWKLGPVAASGVISITITAASAMARAETLTRSTRIASSTSPIITKARRDDTVAPDSSI
jgi:hypothetical protein